MITLQAPLLVTSQKTQSILKRMTAVYRHLLKKKKTLQTSA